MSRSVLVSAVTAVIALLQNRTRSTSFATTANARHSVPRTSSQSDGANMRQVPRRFHRRHSLSRRLENAQKPPENRGPFLFPSMHVVSRWRRCRSFAGGERRGPENRFCLSGLRFRLRSTSFRSKCNSDATSTDRMCRRRERVGFAQATGIVGRPKGAESGSANNPLCDQFGRQCTE